MKLIAGLGNPGNRYKNNRHNAGFLVLDRLADDRGLIFKKKKLYDYAIDRDFILIKPRTFMNLSGIAFASVNSSYSIDEILVVFDDIDLPFGEIRLRHKGGCGGHNGLKSIKAQLGTDEFKRLRIGVGSPSHEQDLANYVLSDFGSLEKKLIPEVISYSVKLLQRYIKEDFDGLLDFHSKNNKTYSEKLEAFQDH
jgi:PTH1 family peptidyl-tRNA hydrolase